MAHGVKANALQRLRGLCVSVTALVLLASPAFAEQNQTASSSNQTTASSPPDFMLGRPRATIGARGSFLVASANSDIYEFVTDVLAIEKSDFNTGSFALEIGRASCRERV